MHSPSAARGHGTDRLAQLGVDDRGVAGAAIAAEAQAELIGHRDAMHARRAGDRVHQLAGLSLNEGVEFLAFLGPVTSLGARRKRLARGWIGAGVDARPGPCWDGGLSYLRLQL